MNLWTVFLTGLLTGGLTCLAVQGGLLASSIAQREEERLKEKAKSGHALPILAFLVAKLVAYTLLGFLLGWFGSLFQLTLTVRVIIQFVVVVFMFGTAFNLLDLHPIFRYFVIQPPKFLTRMVRKQSKSADFFGPAILGGFTVFIPCGTTQAMMALAIASGNPGLGALTMFLFILGTTPLFFILGYFATKLGDVLHQKFMKIAAIFILILAFYNLDGALALTGTPYTFSNMWSKTVCFFTLCDIQGGNQGKQEVATDKPVIDITSFGYSPNEITVKANSSISLKVENTGGNGCIQAFTIPSLGLQRVIPVGGSELFTFNSGAKGQQIPFMCSMGMYRGVINVL